MERGFRILGPPNGPFQHLEIEALLLEAWADAKRFYVNFFPDLTGYVRLVFEPFIEFSSRGKAAKQHRTDHLVVLV